MFLFCPPTWPLCHVVASQELNPSSVMTVLPLGTESSTWDCSVMSESLILLGYAFLQCSRNPDLSCCAGTAEHIFNWGGGVRGYAPPEMFFEINSLRKAQNVSQCTRRGVLFYFSSDQLIRVKLNCQKKRGRPIITISFKSESAKFIQVAYTDFVSLGNFIGLLDRLNLICACLVCLQYSHMIKLLLFHVYSYTCYRECTFTSCT